MTERPICWVPYYSAEINPTGGKACCKHHNDPANPYFDVGDFYSDRAESWRQNMFMGDSLPPQCSSCDRPEGEFTYRDFQHKFFRESQSWTRPEAANLRLIRIGLDNVCASSCMQCGPHYSTTIDQLLRRETDPRFKPEQFPGRTVTDISGLAAVAGDLEWVHIWGGEPLFSPRVPEFIDLLRDASPKLRKISFNTGLRSIKESTVESITKLAHDRNIECWISISLDGDRYLNSWVRGISDQEFDRSMDILSRYRQYWQQSTWSVCVGAFNAFAVPEIIDYTRELENRWSFAPAHVAPIHTTPILKPNELAINQLPEAVKAAALRKIQANMPRLQSQGWSSLFRRPEFVTTVMGYLSEPATSTWADTEFLIDRMPRLRGDDRRIADVVNLYLKDWL